MQDAMRQVWSNLLLELAQLRSWGLCPVRQQLPQQMLCNDGKLWSKMVWTPLLP